MPFRKSDVTNKMKKGGRWSGAGHSKLYLLCVIRRARSGLVTADALVTFVHSSVQSLQLLAVRCCCQGLLAQGCTGSTHNHRAGRCAIAISARTGAPACLLRTGAGGSRCTRSQSAVTASPKTRHFVEGGHLKPSKTILRGECIH